MLKFGEETTIELCGTTVTCTSHCGVLNYEFEKLDQAVEITDIKNNEYFCLGPFRIYLVDLNGHTRIFICIDGIEFDIADKELNLYNGNDIKNLTEDDKATIIKWIENNFYYKRQEGFFIRENILNALLRQSRKDVFNIEDNNRFIFIHLLLRKVDLQREYFSAFNENVDTTFQARQKRTAWLFLTEQGKDFYDTHTETEIHNFLMLGGQKNGT